LLDERELGLVLSTEGMLAPEEAQELATLAAGVPQTEAIVEVGSFRGRSTVALALGSLNGHNAPVFAIEPHEPFRGPLGGHFGPADRRMFFSNLLAAGVVEQVRLVNLTSEVVAAGWRQPLGLLWIDGDHNYAAVRRDVDCWEPHLVPFGVIAFHDAMHPDLGPFQVVHELLSDSRFEPVKAIAQIAVLRKLR
jgi:predicted O-methyltransferase YrrM